MANADHLERLKKGVEVWNAWRQALRPHEITNPDLREPDFSGADLSNLDLSDVNLSKANLSRVYFDYTNLSRANLREANLAQATLYEASLCDADLSWAKLVGAILRKTDLRGSDLTRAHLASAVIIQSDLRRSILSRADLDGTNFSGSNLNKAILSDANLNRAILVDVDLTDADLSGCRVYGVSAWELKLSEGTKQQNLIITGYDEPKITVDDIEVAQFVYLLLHNEKIRQVIDTITSKAVLILGRFTPERKAVLDALRDELRQRKYLPILFDFDKPVHQTVEETVTLLARMARFVIADITDAKSVLQELRAIVPDIPSLPVQPLIIATQEEPGMFDFFHKYPWFLETHRYNTSERLIADLDKLVIGPAEDMVLKLRGAKPG